MGTNALTCRKGGATMRVRPHFIALCIAIAVITALSVSSVRALTQTKQVATSELGTIPKSWGKLVGSTIGGHLIFEAVDGTIRMILMPRGFEGTGVIRR